MGKWKKLTAFAPALAAVIVAACAGISLNGYTAPVYAVEQPEALVTPEPEQDTDAAEKKDDTKKKDDTQKTTDTEAELVAAVGSGSFELADGTYEGSGTGFGGTITVSVVLKDKTIQSISIVSAPGEDAAFLNRAKGVIDRIIASQSVDVDTVSGATFSSKGILAAVKNALTGQEDTSEPASASGAAGGGASAGGTVTVSKIEEPAAYRDGTYYGTGTGFGGTMKVCVVVSGGKIASIDIVENSDTPSYLSSASSLISTIISTQSTNVDTVSGATYSSRGIIEAVRSALSQAAVNGSSSTNGGSQGNTNNGNNSQNNGQNNNNSSASKGSFPYQDGIYYGTAAGFQGDIKVAVALQDQTIKAVLILENEDDETFFNRAKVVADRIVDGQKTDVDLVSGATYSSRGILAAIEEALKEAERVTEEKKNPTPTPTVTPTPTETPEQKIYQDGEYTAIAVCEPDEDEDFTAYQLSVTVTIENDKIVALSNITGDGDSQNASYIRRASEGTSKIKGVSAQILETGTLENIDTVSRATCSSKAILEACRNALDAAKVTQ